MNLKKGIAAILCACMVTGMLSGCGQEKATNTVDGVETVTIWSGNSHSKGVYEKLINEFNQTVGKEKGIRIDYQIKEGGSITQALEVALQNGTAPDMFTGGDLKKMVGNGNVLAIEDLPGGPEIIAKHQDSLVEFMHTYKGKTYSLPFGATTQGLLYNKEMFKKAGIVDENGEAKPPETLDEMVAAAKKLTNPANKEYGIILPQKWDGWIGSDITSTMMPSVGHHGFDPVTGTYDFTGMADVLNAFLAMKADGSVYPGAEGLENDQARALFAAGNIGMKMGFSFDVGVLNDQFPAKIDWGVAPKPVADKDNCYKQQMGIGYSFYTNADAVNHVSPEKLMEVIKFFHSDDFVKEVYKNGVEIPYDWDIVKDVELEKSKKGWKEFCQLVDVSQNYVVEPNIDQSGIRKLNDRIMEDIWSGKQPAEEMLAEYTKEMNGLLEQYKADPANDPIDNYIIPDWNIKR